MVGEEIIDLHGFPPTNSYVSIASALELVREGHAEIHQQEAFSPIFMRKRVAGGGAGVAVGADRTE